MPKSFRRIGGRHCFCQDSEFSVQFSRQCRFLQNRGVNLASARVGALLPAPPSYPVHRTVVWTGASVSGDVSRQHRRLPRWQSRPWRSAGTRPAIRCRPAPPKPPEASAWPSSSPCVLQHSHRGLRGAERALFPRRAREAVLSKPWEQIKSDQG